MPPPPRNSRGMAPASSLWAHLLPPASGPSWLELVEAKWAGALLPRQMGCFLRWLLLMWWRPNRKLRTGEIKGGRSGVTAPQQSQD